ncbi:type II toxin-antitoxin system RelE/ParE family toxin [Methylobacterium radiotolerans]|uniref:type II toxin-antitoxin system RelE/ParE family toxin n=1 Tax=Methylobacterium radiotolerans TaxID=31998 RepID=UPI001F20A847|nr:type II toxin-antitoxin system RelE/ParE family toxin [Methylobacterium radiotolerans]UIY45871.1 type II toxin-antitoxin system RelE/ParE family toxin [Methylobacterium radiotolerans]
MKIYVTNAFSKDATKADVSDDDLREAIARAENGQIDGPLGAYLIKQRIARRGQGRSGGLRTILCFRRGKVAVFLYIFAKSKKANLTKAEQEAYREYAKELAEYTDEQFARLVAERGWRQIEDEQPEEDVPK